MSEYQMVAVGKIVASRTNPRKHFDEHALAELTESVRKHGVLQPILVRPVRSHDWRACKAVTLPGDGKNVWSVSRGHSPDAVMFHAHGLTKAEAEQRAAELNGADFELVAGERRWRAAKASERGEIPAVVRELTDQEVLEIQVIENLQRSDLHPMEEAEGYERLTKEFNYTVEDLAAKVGKSKAYVYGRLKLLALVPKARKAFESGELAPSVALLVARVPAPLQEDVLQEACFDYDGNPAPLRDVQIEIERHYMLRLSEAPWSPKDADLLPAAGACLACPKRTGNQPDLFADVSHKDTCTDPQCFKAKREAWNKRTLAQAKEKGQTVKKTEEVFDEYGRPKRGYVKLDDNCAPLGWESDKTWAQALKTAEVEPIITVTKEGDVVKVLPEKEAIEALKETGAKIKADGHDRYDAEQKRKAKLKAFNTQVAFAAAPKIVESFSDADVETAPDWWAMLAKAAYECTDITAHEFVTKRRGLAKKITEARPALDKWFKQDHLAGEYAGMVVELLLVSRWSYGCFQPNPSAQFRKVCELAGVDIEAIGRELKALEKAKADPKAKKPETKSTPGKKMSASGRARIAAAAKARWAKARAPQRNRFDDPAQPQVQAEEEATA